MKEETTRDGKGGKKTLSMFDWRALFIILSVLTDSGIIASAGPPQSQIHTLAGGNIRLNSVAFPLHCASGFHPLILSQPS